MDLADHAEILQQQEIDRALAAHKARSAVQPQPQRDTCAECGDVLTPARRAMGAQLCVPCQREAELDRGVGR